MTFKLLIDECLLPGLAIQAWDAGHEASCVRDRGWLGLKDRQLIEHVVAGDYTLVTHNSKDFRGPAGTGEGGLHRRQPIHAGLICLNSTRPMSIPRQQRLFAHMLTELAGYNDLVNKALEIFEADNGTCTIHVYDIPES
ncbi:DUF5615 family PIN-like protein [Paraburkholderia sp. J63]|uniref:DUF5615 family PIN-like protein n=1 Tax=Paraburkholderia sp. J63 TaxID=2805434 RepID=UPI002ABE1051|nr:DUF5615 family PIN-like protein [Paraburkholderia sp. J63]